MILNSKLLWGYGSLALFTSILHNVFLLYHMETFVSVYKIDKTSFWIGEAIFMVWNALNDPLFGWQSDRSQLMDKTHHTGASNIIIKRLDSLRWNGPLLALSFLAFWHLWLPPALQFATCLCLYDAFLTKVDLQHSALLADLAISAEKRAQLNLYCSVCSALGSASAFTSYMIWDRDAMFTFQMFCLFLAVFSLCGYILCTKMLTAMMVSDHTESVIQHPLSPMEKSLSFKWEVQKDAMKSFARDLTKHQNFFLFSIMNLVQVFHCHFNSNFFPLFLESLLGDEIPPWVCSLLLGISFVAPHINNMYFLSLVRMHGVYTVINGLFYVKLCLSLVMLLLGPNYLLPLCVFIASNRVFTEGTCKLLNLAITDLIDEDYVIHKRSQAVSALMFGTTAFLSKPGQTLAPLIGTVLLSLQTGHDVFESGNLHGSIRLDTDTLSGSEKENYRLGVFYLLVYVPIGCALVQLLLWSQFTLHGKRLQWIKAIREGVHYAAV